MLNYTDNISCHLKVMVATCISYSILSTCDDLYHITTQTFFFFFNNFLSSSIIDTVVDEEVREERRKYIVHVCI